MVAEYSIITEVPLHINKAGTYLRPIKGINWTHVGEMYYCSKLDRLCRVTEFPYRLRVGIGAVEKESEIS